MKFNYNYLILFSVLVAVALFFSDNHQYMPFAFWGAGLIMILNHGIFTFKFSNKIENKYPELYKKHSFGIMLTRNAFGNKDFLETISDDERNEIEFFNGKGKYFIIMFILFACSPLFMLLK